LGKEVPKEEYDMEENGEIYRGGDQGSHNPTYDEMKHSSDLEDDRAIH